VIENGTITGFQDAIYLFRSKFTKVTGIDADGAIAGIVLFGATRSKILGDTAISEGTGNAAIMVLHATRDLVAQNSAQAVNGRGILLDVSSSRDRVVGNVVDDASTGIEVDGTTTLISGNRGMNGTTGIDVEGPGNRLIGNVMSSQAGFGIVSSVDDVIFSGNTADNNGGLGISAPGAVQSAHDEASGNGNVHQCSPTLDCYLP
jgi:hypothetical protein